MVKDKTPNAAEIIQSGAMVATDLKSVLEKAAAMKQTDDNGGKSEMQKRKEAREELDKRRKHALEKGGLRKGSYIARNDGGKGFSPERLFMSKAVNEDAKAWQEAGDTCLLLGALLKCDPRDTEFYKYEFAPMTKHALSKALDTATAGEGLEWIPTDYSTELIFRIQLEHKIVAALRMVKMPTDPFRFPVENTITEAFNASESLGDTPTQIPTRTPGTRQMQFSTSKLGVRVVLSMELEEDSIVSAIDYVKETVATAIGRGEEHAILNGDTATPHQDSDVTAGSTNRATLLDGLRKFAISITTGGGISLNTFNSTNIATLQADGGVHMIDPRKTLFVCGPQTMIRRFRQLTEVITMDLYGPQATVLSGELGKYQGIPIIVSEEQREDLDTTGVAGNTNSDRSTVLMVRMDAWFVGVKRELKVALWEDVRSDTVQVIATKRLDLQTPWTDQATAVIGINVQT